MRDPTRRATSLVVLLLAWLVAGCTSTSAGEPQPGSSNTLDANSSEETSAPSPMRPRELKLDGIDPCTLLPEADYGDFYLHKPGEPGRTKRGAIECAWYGEIGYMDAVLVTFEGVEARKDRNVETTSAEPIEGFPAYIFTIRNSDTDICFIGVDVADDQYLDVQVGLDGDRPGVPPVCEYAHQFAASIMSTLVAS
ncbi:DUF3558 domain-containing protein [Actinophytocola sediminis]